MKEEQFVRKRGFTSKRVVSAPKEGLSALKRAVFTPKKGGIRTKGEPICTN
ncbi:hypothetical protein [Ureibacillus sp. FSL K6-3587]|uniref:hypothetical protein n=1 Tax=Ureibacillus sp. FSL K6-3587 TaxID=2954681 RepID=UPI0031590DBA